MTDLLNEFILLTLLVLSGTFYLWYPVLSKWPTIARINFPAVPVVTIESDDWGGLREIDFSPDKGSDKDCLESEDDVENLLNVLNKYRDSHNRPAVITLNVVLETIFPDDSGEKIVIECVPNAIIKVWKKGVDKKLFYPQLHAMREADSVAILDVNSTVRKRISPYMIWKNNRYVDLPEERVEKSVREGQEKFCSIFGFKSTSTIAPRYLWGELTAKSFKDQGIKYIQRGRPKVNKEGIVIHQPDQVPGETSSYGMILLGKKVDFEPYYSWFKGKESSSEFVQERFRQIAHKLDYCEPVAITSHRWNYVSRKSPSKPEYGLSSLDNLLEKIVKKYPSIVFLTSPELGEFLEKGSYRDVFTGQRMTLPKASYLQRTCYMLTLGDNTKRNFLVLVASAITLFIIWGPLYSLI